MNKIKHMPRTKRRSAPTFLSLFSGCGGMDLGFTECGFKCRSAVDIDLAVQNTYRANFDSVLVRHDLSSKTLPDHLNRKIDLVIAGSPCQGFSTAGKRELHDPRNQLLLVAGELAISLKPKVFVAENVAGAIAGQHRQYWDRLQTGLRDAGFKMVSLKCQANDLGIPQKRARMFLIAWRSDTLWTPSLPVIPGGNLRSAIDSLLGCKNHEPAFLDPKSKIGMIASHIRPTQKLCNVREGSRSVPTWSIPAVFGKTSPKERELLHALGRLRRRERVRVVGDADPVLLSSLKKFLGRDIPELSGLMKKGYIRKIGHRYDLRNTFNGKFRRLSWDEPSLTVDTRFGQPRYFLHPEELRGFTVREAARIQGFPDTFEFMGSISDQYQMIGNAVPPPMARILAKMIREAFFT